MQRLAQAALCACAALSVSEGSSAFAQGFNVDLGQNLILYPAPNDTYGAGAGQAGVWNEFSYPFQSQVLNDLDGIASNVTIGASAEAGEYSNFMTMLFGDDEDLMEDQLWVPNLGAVISVRFEGLEPGFYEVFTYGWDESGATTIVDVVDAPEGAQTVGGLWNGSPHVFTVTYAKHTVSTLDGVIEIQAQGPSLTDSGGLNGVQIVPSDQILGMQYCVAANNSAGPGAQISGLGSPSVADNTVRLFAEPVPAQPGLFYYGPNQILTPFGDGFRCVGGVVGRLAVTTPVGGTLVEDVDLTNPPSAATQILPGSTWNFQAWFRDPAAGGAGFNLSNGLEITFLP